MFRQMGIYSSVGQRYTPHDSGGILYYKEAETGQILEEGINEAGAFSAWLAAATSYSVSDFPMVPFYIFYSMFGFQRIGDLAWAAGDSQARGFLIGATAGRTTLNGEGLQHQDGHSHLMAATVPIASVMTRLTPMSWRSLFKTMRRMFGGELLLHHHHERELRPPRHARGC